MSIRIGEDGTIISTDGDIQQGLNPLIGEDGSIRFGEQSLPASQTNTTRSRRPPASPLENNLGNNRESTSNRASSNTSRVADQNSSRSVSTIEYELQVKKAELNKCIRPIPIVVCIVFVLLAILLSTPLPAIVSAIAVVLVVMDISKRSQVAEEVRKLESELEKTRNRGDR